MLTEYLKKVNRIWRWSAAILAAFLAVLVIAGGITIHQTLATSPQETQILEWARIDAGTSVVFKVNDTDVRTISLTNDMVDVFPTQAGSHYTTDLLTAKFLWINMSVNSQQVTGVYLDPKDEVSTLSLKEVSSLATQ